MTHPACRTEGVPDSDTGMAGNPDVRDRQQASGGYDIDNESSGNEVPGQPEGSQDSSGSLPDGWGSQDSGLYDGWGSQDSGLYDDWGSLFDEWNSQGGSGLQSIGGGTEA